MRFNKFKKILFIIVIAIFILYFYFRPVALIDAPNDFEIYRVTYQENDITNLVNLDRLTTILIKYVSRRTFHSYDPYFHADVILEIDCIDGKEPKHIVLGKFNFCYNDKGTRNIIDSEKLIYEIINNVINK